MRDAAESPNAILLPFPGRYGVRNFVLSNGARATAQDASFLPFIAEELVRHSAARLALDVESMLYRGRDALPQVFRDRLIEVDHLERQARRLQLSSDPFTRRSELNFSPRW